MENEKLDCSTSQPLRVTMAKSATGRDYNHPGRSSTTSRWTRAQAFWTLGEKESEISSCERGPSLSNRPNRGGTSGAGDKSASVAWSALLPTRIVLARVAHEGLVEGRGDLCGGLLDEIAGEMRLDRFFRKRFRMNWRSARVRVVRQASSSLDAFGAVFMKF